MSNIYEPHVYENKTQGRHGFVPTLFIGVGATGALFTLRETYLHQDIFDHKFKVWSFHHFNLSQDPDAAYEKAVERAGQMGLRLTTTREKLEDELREIKRANAETIAERAAAREAEAKYWEDQRALQKAQRDAEQADLLKAGRMPFGRHEGLHFSEVERGYINWMFYKREEFEEGSILRRAADELFLNHQNLKLPVPSATLTLGKPKERVTFTGTAIKCAYYDGEFGRTYFTTFCTPEGICVVTKTGRFSAEPGEVLTLKATVKEHSQYNGQAQTIVQRVVILEESARA